MTRSAGGSPCPPSPSGRDRDEGGRGAAGDLGTAHVPVLLDAVADALAPSLGGQAEQPGDRASPRVLVDATLGLAGHAVHLLRAHPGTRLVGVDRDPEALGLAAERLRRHGLLDRCELVRATFDEVDAIMPAVAAAGRSAVDAVLLDLGVSSLQLDSDQRGFAYSRDTPLDMRMDAGAGSGPTAADVLNTYPVDRLAAVLRDHGDERFARAVAAAVADRRARTPLRTTGELVQLVYETVPAPARRTGGHPAKRVFQALRIEVNDELGSLRRALPAWLDRLARGGRLAALAYHSGEDRVVKRALAARTSVDVPPGLPVEPPAPAYRLAHRRPVTASAAEVAANPRAAPARLRVVERVAGPRGVPADGADAP